MRVASTGVCTYSTQIDVSSGALQDYRPDPIESTTSGGSPESFIAGGGRDGNGGSYEVILGETDVYPFMSATDFTLTHVSTTGASGLPATSGPFVPPTLECRRDPMLNTTLLLIGYLRPSYSQDQSVNTSVYRVTYTPSGLYRNFNYYWAVNI